MSKRTVIDEALGCDVFSVDLKYLFEPCTDYLRSLMMV